MMAGATRHRSRGGGHASATDALAGSLARVSARQRVLEGPRHDLSGSALYHAGSGWEAAELAVDPELTPVRTPGEARAALADPAVTALWVPLKSALPLAVLAQLCAESGLGKTIYAEGDAP